jgi:hypothetical protein
MMIVMECEKEGINVIRELMNYYQEEMCKAKGSNKSIVPYRIRYLHSSISYFTLLEKHEQELLIKRNRELDSMLENISQESIPCITQCRKEIEESIIQIGEYTSRIRGLKEEKMSLYLANADKV